MNKLDPELTLILEQCKQLLSTVFYENWTTIEDVRKYEQDHNLISNINKFLFERAWSTQYGYLYTKEEQTVLHRWNGSWESADHQDFEDNKESDEYLDSLVARAMEECKTLQYVPRSALEDAIADGLTQGFHQY